MLNHSRKLPVLFQRSVRLFSTLNAKLTHLNLKSTTEEACDDGQALMQLHQDYFSSSDSSQLYNLRSGTYVQVPEDIGSKFVPEGLGGEIDDEFKFAHKKMWMIRDTTKIICRILDDHKNKTDTISSSSLEPQGFSPVQFCGKPEWDSAKLQISVNGKNLLKESDKVSSTNFNLADSCFKTLKSEGIPNKIMLTGKQ